MTAPKQPKTFQGFRLLISAYGDIRSEPVGEFRVLTTRTRQPSEGRAQYGVGPTITHTICAPRGASTDRVRAALRDTFTTGCHCAHDCCGHMSSYPSRIRKARRRNWVVEVYTAFNV